MKKIDTAKLEAATNYLESWLDFNFKDSRIPGMVVAIQHKDKLVLNKAYGYADQPNKVSMTTNHTFRIASHSKTFTATAIMQLHEANKLGLDDKISSHLKWFGSANDKDVENITIRHFLNHTSGLIRDGVDADFWQLNRAFPDATELKEFAKNSKLQTLHTSENFKYSNFGYSYLGMVIEEVSGLTYNEYVKKNIVDKLGLSHVSPELPTKKDAQLALGHSAMLFNSARTTLKHVNTDAMSPATGFCSTASDLCSYFSAHFYGNLSLLSDSSKREMQHGSWASDRYDESYGLGMVEYKYEYGSYFGHGGGLPGFITASRFDPHQKLIVTVLTNDLDGPAGFIAKKILGIFNYFQVNEGSEKNASKFSGRFYALWGPMDVVNVNGKIIALSPIHWGDFSAYNTDELQSVDAKTLRIEAKNSYLSPGEEISYTFDKTTGGVKSVKAAGITMLQENEHLLKLKNKT